VRSADGNSFDHLVGAPKQRWWNINTKRTRGLQIDDKLKLGRLENWQVLRFDTLENAAGVNANLAKHVGEAGRIAHQDAGFGHLPHKATRWQSIAYRQSGKLNAAAGVEAIARSASTLSRVKSANAASISAGVLALKKRISNARSRATFSGRLRCSPRTQHCLD
jgi:hypothetical protein